MEDYFEICLRKDGRVYFVFKVYPYSTTSEIEKNFDNLLNCLEKMEDNEE